MHNVTWTFPNPAASQTDYVALRAALGNEFLSDDRPIGLWLSGPQAWTATTAKLGFAWKNAANEVRELNVTVAVKPDCAPDAGQLLIVLPGYLHSLVRLGGSLALRALNAAGVGVNQTPGLVVTGHLGAL